MLTHTREREKRRKKDYGDAASPISGEEEEDVAEVREKRRREDQSLPGPGKREGGGYPYRYTFVTAAFGESVSHIKAGRGKKLLHCCWGKMC